MSKIKSIVKEPTEETTPEPLFKVYDFHKEEVGRVSLPGWTVMELALLTADIANGVATVLEIRQRDAIEPSFENSQLLFGDAEHGVLARLSVAALKLLRNEAEELTEWAYNEHTPEGRAERRGRS